jgi:hypothetical protein
MSDDELYEMERLAKSAGFQAPEVIIPLVKRIPDLVSHLRSARKVARQAQSDIAVTHTHRMELMQRAAELEQVIAPLMNVRANHQWKPDSTECWANCVCCQLAKVRAAFDRLNGTETTGQLAQVGLTLKATP